MCISILPKHAVASIVGYLKGKSAITVARNFLNRKRNFSGKHFWARGYFVSTVGLDEAMVREYIRNQEKEDERLEQLTLGLEKRDPL
jgi:putative transposase